MQKLLKKCPTVFLFFKKLRKFFLKKVFLLTNEIDKIHNNQYKFYSYQKKKKNIFQNQQSINKENNGRDNPENIRVRICLKYFNVRIIHLGKICSKINQS